MNDPARRRAGLALGLVIVAVLGTAAPAFAVIPGLSGPLQSLQQVLPQILPFLIGGLVGVLRVPKLRQWFGRALRWLTSPVGILLVVPLTCATAFLVLNNRDNRSVLGTDGPTVGRRSENDWPLFRADVSRSGAADRQPGPKHPKVRWTFEDESHIADFSSSPAIAGNRVYAGSAFSSFFDSGGMVYCLDAATGNRLWQLQTDKPVFCSPSVVKGKVYVGEGLHTDTGCKLYCLDAATGKPLWFVTTKSHTESGPTVAGGRIYFGAGDDGVYCADANTGKVLWHFEGRHVDVSPLVAGGRVYFGSGYGTLEAIALDAATGKRVWTYSSDLPVWGEPTDIGNRVYFAGGNGDFVQSWANPRGFVACLDSATGNRIWRRDLPDAVMTAILTAAEHVYVGCRDGKVYCLNAASGDVVWSVPCGSAVVASPASDGKTLFAASSNGVVSALDLRSGSSSWQVDLRPELGPDVQLFSSPALAGGKVYLGTSKSKLLCLGG